MSRDGMRVIFSDGPISPGFGSHKSRWKLEVTSPARSSSRTNLWAAIRHAHAARVDRLIYFEDDVFACGRAIERMLATPMVNKCGLITFHDYKEIEAGKKNGLYVVPITGRYGTGFWGLQSVVFSRGAIEVLAKQDPFSVITESPTNSGDRAVELFLQSSYYNMIEVHVPALVRHTGAISIAHPGKELSKRQSQHYRSDDFDAVDGSSDEIINGWGV